MKIIVIGSGIGGLGVSALLAKNGFEVLVIEKNKNFGGRARALKEKGFTFDLGPSWYMMPDVFENYFSLFGKKSCDFYKLYQLKTHYKIFFENDIISVKSDLKENIREFERFEKNSGKKLLKYLEKSKYIYEKAMKDLVYLDYENLRDIIKPEVILELFKLNLFKSFHDEVKGYFKNDKLQKTLEFTTVFLGGSPFNTPAFYTLISHTDFNLKIWHPEGGMNKVSEALFNLCKEYNVKFVFNEEIKKVNIVDNKINSIEGKKRYYADAFICNADMIFFDSLLPKEFKVKKNWDKCVLSPSAFNIYIGINKKLRYVEHHNFYFESSWEKHFEDVYKNPKWPKNPSYYVHIPSITDKTMAPKNCESLYFLVPVAPGLEEKNFDKNMFADKIIEHFEKVSNQKIKENIVIKKIFSHNDFIREYNSYKGTAFGLAHTLMQTAILRPKNKGKLNNLWYVGQYTNPGIGVPTSLISSIITYNSINRWKKKK
ncbi:MAG: phytoene desaturase family protein [Candidatus Woesearchaeota archaeon]